MKIKIFLACTLTVLLSSFQFIPTGKVVSVAEFKKFLDSTGLAFEMPDGFTETTVNENRDLWYAFAIKSKTAHFEIRYTVWPLKEQLEEYAKCKHTPNCLRIDPNNTYSGRVQANALNMTAGEGAEVRAFPPDAVRNEFNADDGGTAVFEPKCEFGKGYKLGQMVYLHKDSIADVIVSYLSDDRETHAKYMDAAFHAIRFK